MSQWTLTTMAPADLKDHPASIEIYGDDIPSDLMDSIKQHGVLEPLRCLPDGTLLSGHRRRQCAARLKLDAVPVLRRKAGIPDAEQVIEIVEANHAREKTMSQKAREFSRLQKALAEIAARRMKTGKKRTDDPIPKKVEGVPKSHSGTSSAEAAAKVGLGRDTAIKAAEVVKTVDSLKASGEAQKAAELEKKLNTGPVAAAHRAAKGEPERPRKQPEPKKTAQKQDNFLPLNEAIEELNAAVREVRKQWPEDQLAILPAKLRKIADEIEKSIK